MSVQSLQVVLGQVSSGITLFDIKAAAFHFVESTINIHISSLFVVGRNDKDEEDFWAGEARAAAGE